MPYRVEEVKTAGGAHDEVMLNQHEEDGWTLVNIVQGFQTVHEDGKTRVFWFPRFVFYKPAEEPESPATAPRRLR